MNFIEDVPNSSQSFMSFVDQVYYFFKTCTYSLLCTLFQSSYLFLQQYPFFQILKSKLNLNIQVATPNSSLLACALIFFCVFVLGREHNLSFDPCTEKSLNIHHTNK